MTVERAPGVGSGAGEAPARRRQGLPPYRGSSTAEAWRRRPAGQPAAAWLGGITVVLVPVDDDEERRPAARRRPIDCNSGRSGSRRGDSASGRASGGAETTGVIDDDRDFQDDYAEVEGGEVDHRKVRYEVVYDPDPDPDPDIHASDAGQRFDGRGTDPSTLPRDGRRRHRAGTASRAHRWSPERRRNLASKVLSVATVTVVATGALAILRFTGRADAGGTAVPRPADRRVVVTTPRTNPARPARTGTPPIYRGDHSGAGRAELPILSVPTSPAPLSSSSTSTAAASPPRAVEIVGELAFPYLEGLALSIPLTGRVSLVGGCNGGVACTITSPYRGAPFEGQPPVWTLEPTGTGYSSSTRFLHVKPGPLCAPIPVVVSLTLEVAEGTDGWGIRGAGQFVPERRSSPLPDGSPGCQTDVATFTFASSGLAAPAMPPAAPPPVP